MEFKQYESFLFGLCESVNTHRRGTYPNLYHIKDPKTDKNEIMKAFDMILYQYLPSDRNFVSCESYYNEK